MLTVWHHADRLIHWWPVPGRRRICRRYDLALLSQYMWTPDQVPAHYQPHHPEATR